MANEKSQIITDLDATPAVKTNPVKIGGRVRSNVAFITFATAATSDVKRFTRISSRARVEKVELANDDIDTNATPTVAADIGLYDINGGAVVDADFFASAIIQLQAAQPVYQDVTYESGVVTVANRAKRVWEQLGLTADSNKEYDVALTLTTGSATFAAGSAALRVKYVLDE